MAADVKKEYMKVALMFLKATRLLPLWKCYINEEYKKSRHWSNVEFIEDIFGLTKFTSFIVKKLEEKNGKKYREGLFLYERFLIWLKEMNLLESYPVKYRNKTAINRYTKEEISKHIIINPVTKKVELIFQAR